MGRGIDSRNWVWNWVAKQRRLAGRYDNTMPTWFLAPIAGLKVPLYLTDGGKGTGCVGRWVWKWICWCVEEGSLFYAPRPGAADSIRTYSKKNCGMWAWIFCWVFCATSIFWQCKGKLFEHRLSANLWPSDYDQNILPLRHCILVYIMLWHSLCSLLGFSGRFCSYWQPNFPAVSGSYLPGFSGCICSYWQPDFRAVSVVTCRNFLALPFLAKESKKSPARDQKAGIFGPYLLFLAGIFRT